MNAVQRTLEPDTILYNGRIWTVDDALPRAEAIAISDGRILAVGKNDEVLPLVGGKWVYES